MKTKNCLTKLALVLMCCVFALSFAFVGVNSVTASAAVTGTGTSTAPYVVESEADLLEVVAKSGTSTIYIKFAADIELTGDVTFPNRTVNVDLDGHILNLGAYKLTMKRSTTFESKGDVNGIITANAGNSGLVVDMSTTSYRLTIKPTINVVAIKADLVNKVTGNVTNNAVDGNVIFTEDKVTITPIDEGHHTVVTTLEDLSEKTLVTSIACVADDGNCLTARVCVCGNVLATAESAHLYEDPCSVKCEREGCTDERENVPHVLPEEIDADCATPVICANEECGATIVEAKVHDFTSPDEETLATVCNAACQNEGCEYNRIPPHDDPSDDTDCETPVYCGLCGDTVVPAVDHTYDDDCDADCNVCGTVRDDAPHYALTPGDNDCTTEEVCGECGNVAIAAIAHKYDTDCGDADNICNNEGCDHVYDPNDENETLFTGHTPDEESDDYKDNDCTTEVLCTVCGQVAIEALTHVWDGNCDEMCNNEGCYYSRKGGAAPHVPGDNDGDCTNDILCEVCNAVVAEGLEHEFDHDCYDADGFCNNEDCLEEFVAIAHTPDEESDAFLDNDCETEVLCEVCGQVAIEALEHTFDNACDVDCNNPDCAYERETVHEYNYSELDFNCTTEHQCVHCGEWSTPYSEHEFTACDDATCNNPECDYVRVAPGHDYTAESDCTKATRCTVCDNIVIAAEAEHDFPADCTSETCTKCEVENPNWVDHTYEDDDDCTTAVYCDVCSVEIVPAADHVYSDTDPCDPHCDVCGTSRVVLHKPVYSLDCTVASYCELCGDEVIAALDSHTSDNVCLDGDGFCNNEGCNVAFDDFKVDHTPDDNYNDCGADSYCEECGDLLKSAGEHTPEFPCYDPDGVCEILGCGYNFVPSDFKTHTPDPDSVDNDCTTETTCKECGCVTTTAQTHVFDFACYDEDGLCNNHGCLVAFVDAPCVPDANIDICDAESVCTVCSEVLKEAGEHTPEYPCYDPDGLCQVCGYEFADGELATHTPDETSKDNDCSTPTYCVDCGIVTTLPQTHVFDFDCYDADGICNNHGCLVAFVAVAECIPDDNYGICDAESVCTVCNQTLQEAGEHTPEFPCYDSDGLCQDCGYAFADGELATHTPDEASKDNDCETATTCEVCGQITTTAQTHRFDFDCYDADGFCNNHGCLVAFVPVADCIPDANFGICDAESVCTVCSEVLKEAGEHTPEYPCYDPDGVCNIAGCGYKFTEDDFVVHTPVDPDNDCTTATVCDVCGQITTAAKEHSFDEVCYDEDGICNNHGCLEDITALLISHSAEADDNDCDTDTLCEVCGEVYEEAPGHNYAQGECDAECDVCGYMRAIEHVEAAHSGRCDEPVVCEKCGVILEAASEHVYSNNCGDIECDVEGCGFNERPEEELVDEHVPFYVNDCTQDVECMYCGTFMYAGQADHVYTDDCDDYCDTVGCAYMRDDAPHYALTPDDNDCTTEELCSKCGDVIIEGKDAHTSDEVCYDEDGKCEYCDYEFVEGDFIAHVNANNDFDCTSAEYCDVCNFILAEEQEHSYCNPCMDLDCDNEGCNWIRDIVPEDHTPNENHPNYLDNDCTTAVPCLLCGYTAIPAMEHIYDHVCFDDDMVCNNDGCKHKVEDGELVDHINDGSITGSVANDFNCETAEYCDVCTEELEAELVHIYENECGDRSCNNPGCDYLRPVAPKAHTPFEDDGDCTTEVLCKVCGYVAIEANAEHTPEYECYDEDMKCEAEGCECEIDESLLDDHIANEHNDLCTSRQYCTVCDFTLVEAKDEHDFDDLCDDLYCNNPYCVYKKDIEDLEAHTWIDDGNCFTPAFCTECGHVAVAAKTYHTYDADCFDEDGICNLDYCTHEVEAGELVGCTAINDNSCLTDDVCPGCERIIYAATVGGHTYDFVCSDMWCNNEFCTYERTPDELDKHTYTLESDYECTDAVYCELCKNLALHRYEAHQYVGCEENCRNGECTATREVVHTYPVVDPRINEKGLLDCTLADVCCTVCDKILIAKNEAHSYISVCDPSCDVEGCDQQRVAPHVEDIVPSTNCMEATYCPSCNEIVVNATNGHVYDNPCADMFCNNANCVFERTATDLAAHTPEKDDNYCLSATKCVHCKAILVEAASSHVYDNECDITCNNEGCEYTKKTSELSAHKPEADDGNCLTAVKCTVCQVIVLDASLDHIYDNSCDTKCNNLDGKCTKGNRNATHAPEEDDGNCTTRVLCLQCNAVDTPAKSHTYSNTCSDVTCDNEGCYYVRSTSDLKPHVSGEDDGNCTTPVYCANSECTAITVEAKNHTFADSCDKTCENDCDYTRDIRHTPEADDGDCGTAIRCKICGEITTAAVTTGHAFSNACDSTCNNEYCQFTKLPAHAPNADDGDCTTAVVCSACGQVTTAIKAHAFDNACDASCNNAGCNYTRSAGKHVLEADDANCSTARACAVCGEVPAGYEAKDHTYGVLNAYCTDEDCKYVATWMIIVGAALAFIVLLLILAIVFRIAGGSKRGRNNCKAMKYGGMYPRR